MSAAPQTEAKISCKNLAGAALVTLALSQIPYAINFLTRKPLKETRFNIDTLLHGTAKEKLMQLHYFMADIAWGWPSKSAKQKTVRNEDGDLVTKIVEEQHPGGGLGNGLLYLTLITKSLEIPFKAIATGTAATVGLVKIYNLDFKV